MIPSVASTIEFIDEDLLGISLAGVTDVESTVAMITRREWVKLVDPQGVAFKPGAIFTTSNGGPWIPASGVALAATPSPVSQSIATSGDNVEVFPYVDQLSSISIGFRINSSSAEGIGAFTRQNIGRPLSILVDNVVVSSPVLMAKIGDQGIISGREKADAVSLAIQLSAAPLPARIVIEHIETISS